MSGLPEPLSRLIGELRRLPGIGEKSAQRIAFHLLQGGRERAEALGAAASTLHDRVSRCRVCGNFTDAQPCAYCRNQSRDDAVLCVVDDPADIAAVEKAKIFNGRYHVLGGIAFPPQGDPEEERSLASLLQRVRDGHFEEVIVATNPTHDGEAAAAWLAHLLKPQGIRVTRIGIGIPMGSELVYTDETTMAEALHHRNAL